MSLTPQTHEYALGKIFGLKNLFFKREDLHPYHSHKGRSIPNMIDHALKSGLNRFVISSSGNAALAGVMHINRLNDQGVECTLKTIVGKNINQEKLTRLQTLAKGSIELIQDERPLQTLHTFTQEGYISLRQSTNETATTGYHTLAHELLAIPDLEAIFVGMSSGTTLQGIGEGFKYAKKTIKLFGIQTTACHPIADAFGTFENTENSIADAIVDKTALRKDIVVKLIKNSEGEALVVTDDEIKHAQHLIKTTSALDISTNSALSVAGFIQAIKKHHFSGAVVCIICGK